MYKHHICYLLVFSHITRIRLYNIASYSHTLTRVYVYLYVYLLDYLFTLIILYDAIYIILRHMVLYYITVQFVLAYMQQMLTKQLHIRIPLAPQPKHRTL